MSLHSLSDEFHNYSGDLSQPLDRAVGLFHTSMMSTGRYSQVGNDGGVLSKHWENNASVVPLQYIDENGRTISVKISPLGVDRVEVSYVPLNPRGKSESFILHMRDGLSTDVSRLSFRNEVVNCPMLRKPGAPRLAVCSFRPTEPEPVLHEDDPYNNNVPMRPLSYHTPQDMTPSDRGHHNTGMPTGNHDLLSRGPQPGGNFAGYGGHELVGPDQLLNSNQNNPNRQSPDQPQFGGPFRGNEQPHGGPSGPGIPRFNTPGNANFTVPSMKPRFDPYGPYPGMGDPSNDMEQFPKYKKGPSE